MTDRANGKRGGATFSRRQVIQAGLAGAAGLIGASTLGSAAWAMARPRRKPNLLFIWTDEQRADTLAAYGNSKIMAPNLNRLARQSVVFEKAYITQPVCTPSRSTMMTGLYPHTNGCVANNIALQASTPCLPQLLAGGDYHTGHIGKWHLGGETVAQHGFDEWASIESYEWEFPAGGPIRNSDYDQWLIGLGYKPDQPGDRFSRDFAARLPIDRCKPKFMEMRACDFLRRNRSRPFVLEVNFLEPHMPFYGPLDGLYDPAQVDLPPNFADPLEDNEPLRYRVDQRYCQATYGRSEQDIRKLIAKYWGLVTQMDRSVGAILKTLDDLGLADDTIVVFTSDHGDMMGSHGLVEKMVMYEEAVRVPWLMRIPGRGNPHMVIDGPVSSIDMVPTVLDLMGAKAGAPLQGQSLVPLMAGGKVAEDHVFIEWGPGQGAMWKKDYPDLGTPQELDRVANEHTRTVVSPDGWKLCLSDADRCQLFNLNADPYETTNIFDAPGHREVIDRLAAKIRQWQQQTGDTVKV